jgi:hypothetical protein
VGESFSGGALFSRRRGESNEADEIMVIAAQTMYDSPYGSNDLSGLNNMLAAV